MNPENITIAVTCFSRRKYVRQAVASALNQTVPVRVMVVEDCSPDPESGEELKEQFGSRIQYVRNPRRRGVFDNWNACLESCQTEWLSILHDDDLLTPVFVAEMVKLAGQAPGLDLYFGMTSFINADGEPIPGPALPPVTGPWTKITLTDIIFGTPFAFPGQLFRVSAVKSVGGFCANSYYCGDWQMWAKLIARTGAAQTREVVAVNRLHDTPERATSRVYRKGRTIPDSLVQHKRVLALLPPSDRLKLDRVEYLRHYLVPVRFLLRHGDSLSPRLLRYHAGTLLLSPAPHWRYAVFQQLTRLGGARFVKLMSKIWNRAHGRKSGDA